jgi:hypothetical protein
MRGLPQGLLLFVLLWLYSLEIAACSLISPPPQISPSPAGLESPTTTIQPQAPSPTQLIILSSPTVVLPDTGWEILLPGLERRTIHLQDGEGIIYEKLYILRLEPERFRFDVAYHPVPQSLEAWGAESSALVVLNGGFYREENGIFIPNGLTIVDGEVLGRSFGSFAGMFAVTLNGPELRWLAQQPYNPAEPLLAALQSFPMLVRPGGELGFSEEHEDNQRARRTVIGQDGDGRLLFIVASIGTFTLHQLSIYLVESDFDLDIAINLDGGPSSGVLLTEPLEGVSALNLLPVVITVHAH